MLIRARTYAEGRRVALVNITPRVLRFVDAFVSNGGRGAAAAITAGYSKSSSGVTCVQLLKKAKILDLIAAEIRRRPVDYQAAKASKKLLRPSRPEWLRVRFKLALEKHRRPKIVGTPEHPAVIGYPGEDGCRVPQGLPSATVWNGRFTVALREFLIIF
jgi:hypothetical protein